MLYSKQKWFCNNCGAEQNAPMVVGSPGCIGGKWKTCSNTCLREVMWKETLSIMGREYYPLNETSIPTLDELEKIFKKK